MYCPECGEENPADAQFCGECGKPLAIAEQPVKQQQEPITRVVETYEAQESVSAGLKWGVIAVSVFIPLIGIAMGLYFMLKGDNPEQKSVGQLWLWVGLGMGVLYVLLSSSGGY